MVQGHSGEVPITAAFRPDMAQEGHQRGMGGRESP